MNAFYFTQRTGARFMAAFALLSLIAGLVPAQAFADRPEPKPEVPKVEICHSTNSTSNPYNGANADQTADAGGHDGHNPDNIVWYPGIIGTWGDIIPPFQHDDISYAGKNWTAEGQAILAAGCKTTGNVKVTKIVSGGTAVVGDFSLFVGNIPVESGKEKKDVVMGTYKVTETGPTTNYNATFSGACDSDGDITVVPGKTANCTITNTYIPPVTNANLTVTKVISGIENILKSAFGFTINSGPSVAFETDGSNDNTVNLGAYTVVESGVAGGKVTVGDNTYSVGYSAGCSGTLAALGATCTITNTYVPPAPTLCTDPLANNNGQTLPCTYTDLCPDVPGNQADTTLCPAPTMCLDDGATNYNQEGVCTYNYESVCINPDANLLVNGSFEDPVITAPWAKSAITGWAVAKVSDSAPSLGEIWRGLVTPSHLLQNLELDGDYPTKITQSTTTIPGATYELRFDFAAREGYGVSDNSVLATADTTTIKNISTANTKWTTYGGTFVADASTDVTLADMGTANSLGTLIDNAVLCLVREPAPADYCPNVIGNQTADEGYSKDINGQCYRPINSCSVSVVSDTSNLEGDSAALLVTAHPAWVQTITGSLAQWIWGSPVDSPISGTVDETQTFTKTFVWSGTPATAILKIASDNGYSVKLNGTAVGNDAGEFNYSATDTIVDLTDNLIQGVNTLEISVTNKANGATSLNLENGNPAGLIYDLTITNTTGECGDGGGDGDNDRLYRIQGYAWYDDNRNTEWDGRNDEQEGDEEDVLSGWTIKITNGDGDNRETTTDENGFYYFDVPAGTWTITEEVEDGWMRTTQESYTVTVPDSSEDFTLLDSIISAIIPTAYAADVVVKIDTYGDYDFGNDRRGGGGGGNSAGDRDNDDDRDGEVLGDSDDREPVGAVLGEQVDAVPTGAPNTGKGGASTVVLGQFLAIPRRRNAAK